MSFKVQYPAGEIFRLEKTDQRFNIPDEDQTTVTIREATHAEDSLRSVLFGKYSRIMDMDHPRTVRVDNELTYPQIIEKDIFLTMCGCNIVDTQTGAPLFRFRQVGSVYKLDMQESEFKDALGRLPSFIVDEIHEKVIEKNANWAGQVGEV